MGLCVTALVFFVFVGFVQCHRHLDLGKDLAFNRGRPPSEDVSNYLHSSSASRESPLRFSQIRSRRQTKNGNSEFSWVHRFTITDNQPTSLTKETAFVWQDSTKRLKHALENDAVIQFLKPTGMRIAIPANSVNMKIVDFRAKLNDEFRTNEGGHFLVNNYKRDGMWIFEIPQLKLKNKDQLYYWMRLALSKEAFDVVVKGVVEITSGNPHVTDPQGEPIPFRPTSPVLSPQNYGVSNSPANNRGGFAWNHQFTINATYSNTFTKEFATNWQQHAEFIKRFLEKNINFQFQTPSGLIISIPDDSLLVSDFRLKLNDEFRENDLGHFAPTLYKNGNMWTYYIPQLRIQQGDRVYYQMMVKRIKDGFDAIVRGLLEIRQGDPHTTSNTVTQTSGSYQYNQKGQVSNSYSPVGNVQQPITNQQQHIGNIPQPIGVIKQPVGNTQQLSNVNPIVIVQQPSGNVQQSTGNVQQPMGNVQKPIVNGQQPIVNAQQPIVNVQRPTIPSNGDQLEISDRFGDFDGSDRQEFKWNHKFSSINLNKTSEAGITPSSGNWADQADEYFKKTLDRDINFEFLNPSGLRILLSGDDNNLRVLAFHVKLNEEFKSFDSGHYQANISRSTDGTLSYYYPNLKLKQGDNVYYWMKVTFGREMWYYIVKGLLEIKLGNPHKVINSIGTTSAPRPTYAGPSVGNGQGIQPVRWEHIYSINKTSDDLPAYNSPEEAQLLKHTFEDDIDFKFLNPSGLNILFSGENKNFRLLALNIKLNEDFATLGPGDYVANITKVRDVQLSYYYPNLKIKLGDTLYYWMRAMLGRDRADYIIKGHLKLTQGDPHIGGPVPDVPPPVIWTQAPTEPSVWTNQPSQVQYPVKVPPPNPPSGAQTNSPPPLNEPLKRPTQPPLQNYQRAAPLPLSLPPNSPIPCSSGVYPEGTYCQDGVVVRFRDGVHEIIVA
ncbi:uncharacterized protein LOC129002678 [Macrosteles quadrilineatus]|uniref:uncharacterized protein LOC129002678 n=1 Tax=Macrosteles quadrilineatus TaxID=74068 RepID=UPI0023E34651|nr:uncharacterized protein LOC129002678 [Macrosteles quadrilineatus]